MPDESKNIYKIAREFAGLTQEQASPLLHCSVRSIGSYEAGANVPDDVVDKMAKEYRSPVLALLHLKRSGNPLGKYIPDVIPPQTIGDVGMQAVLSQIDVEDAVRIITGLLRDGRVTPDEHDDLGRFSEIMRVISGRALSAAIYAETIMMQKAIQGAA